MSLKTGETTESSTPAHVVASEDVRGDAAQAEMTNANVRVPHVVVRSEESGVQLNLGDLWAYRELLYFLTWRDVKVRYKQTLMGVAWVVVQPLLTMIVFTLVFNKFARLDTAPVPYPLFAYAGLLVWTFFSGAISSGTNSLISNTSLVTKVYFPRIAHRCRVRPDVRRVFVGRRDCIARVRLLHLPPSGRHFRRRDLRRVKGKG